VTRTTRLALKYLLAHPARLRRIGWAFSRAQRLGLVKRSYRALPIGVRRIAESLPPLTALSRRPLANASDGKPVGVFVGCVMDVLFRDANDATIRVLNRNGFRPSVPAAQTCCGALAIHAGERELARQLARRNIDAFLSGDLDYVVTNAGGCGAALMEYPEWLADDPIYQERAIQFAEKVADIAQVLDKEGWQPPTAGPATVVTYQMSCHLQNVMKAGTAPANILTKIPGVDFRAMADSGRCCGSAGIYNITHPEMAEALLKRKMADIPEGTETIVTGNPGCWMQMLHGVDAYRPSLRVRHLVQVLDDAYAYQSAHDPVAIGASE
jgi:glycolate oxidase iron-sulfur subunit